MFMYVSKGFRLGGSFVPTRLSKTVLESGLSHVHFSEAEKVFRIESEIANDRQAAHVSKFWYQHFVAHAPVTQQVEKRRCASSPAFHLIRPC
jgi:hypothetical protein